MSQRNKMFKINKIKLEKSLLVMIFMFTFLLFLSMLFVYLQNIERKIQEDYADKESLLQIDNFNEKMNTVFMHSYRDNNHDEILEVVKGFDTALLLLKNQMTSEKTLRCDKHISSIEQEYYTKVGLIEDFKTLNARIINTTYYLYTLHKALIIAKDAEEMNAVVHDTLFKFGQVFIGKIVDMKMFKENIQILKKYRDYSQNMKYFYMHSKRLREDIIVLQSVLKKAKALHLKKTITKMYIILEEENTKNKEEEKIIAILFFIFAFVLVLIVILTYIRIVSQRKEMHRLAYHDTLTQLPNRLQFDEYIHKILEEKGQVKKPFILLFIDLDRFKVINDTLGHDIGDEILILVAQRIEDTLGQKSFISRLGGDEFIAIIEEATALNRIESLVASLVVEIRRPLLIKEYSLNITASVGMVKYPEDGNDKSTLLKYADSAMYHAKALGKDRYAFYNTQLSVDMHRRLELEQELLSALEAKEFSLVFQPQYSLESMEMTGVEALVRWKNKLLGKVSPEEFISIAEDIGLIIDLGYYIFKEACESYMDWTRQGLDIGLISINISSVQLRNHDTFERFCQIIEETGMDAHNIEIELTERYIMEYTTENLTILDDLRAIGCKISIDDFGTGYSSMSYLKSLAIDTIKIDKSFIGDLVHNQHDNEVSKAIIVLSQTLGYKVIAEGIETKAQEDILSSYGCDMGQGYYFSRPLSSQKLVEFYHQQQK